MIGVGVNIVIGGSRVDTPVGLVATAATGVGVTSFTANWNAYSGAEYYLLDVSTSSSFSTFIYQDQVVLAPTTSYVVIGLTENTTYYYRLRASTDPFGDVDYLAFYNRVIAAGGTLTPTEQIATNQLVLDLKANSLWTPMKAIYPMVGASAEACKQNLKSSSFTGTFTSGWTFASTGATPNGTSAYMDTGLVANGNISQNSSHISYYSRTNNALLAVMMGTYTPHATYLTARFAAAGAWHANNSTERPNNLTEWTDSSGFFISNRISSSEMSVFRNTTKQTDALASTGLSNLPIWIGGQNENNTVPRLPTNKECALASIGDGLTDTQASNFYTAVQAFQTTLSRNV